MKERRLNTDPHALGYARANEPLKHMPQFQSAFQCKAKSAMVPAREEKGKNLVDQIHIFLKDVCGIRFMNQTHWEKAFHVKEIEKLDEKSSFDPFVVYCENEAETLDKESQALLDKMLLAMKEPFQSAQQKVGIHSHHQILSETGAHQKILYFTNGHSTDSFEQEWECRVITLPSPQLILDNPSLKKQTWNKMQKVMKWYHSNSPS